MGRKRVPSQVVAGHSVVIDLREARSRLLIRKSQHQSLEVGLQLDMALDMGLDVSVATAKGTCGFYTMEDRRGALGSCPEGAAGGAWGLSMPDAWAALQTMLLCWRFIERVSGSSGFAAAAGADWCPQPRHGGEGRRDGRTWKRLSSFFSSLKAVSASSSVRFAPKCRSGFVNREDILGSQG